MVCKQSPCSSPINEQMHSQQALVRPACTTIPTQAFTSESDRPHVLCDKAEVLWADVWRQRTDCVSFQPVCRLPIRANFNGHNKNCVRTPAMKTKYKFGAFERLPRENNIGTTFIANFTQINYVMRKTQNRDATRQLLFHTEFKMCYGTLVSIG